MILASQNVQIAEEKDFVREKISGIFFVNTPQNKSTSYEVLFCLEMKRTCGAWRMKQGFALWSEPSAHGEGKCALRFMARARRFMFAKPMHHYLDASLILCYNKYKNVNQI